MVQSVPDLRGMEFTIDGCLVVDGDIRTYGRELQSELVRT